eukprot:jgi/Botrbrau1/14242/Bobra.0381s0005.2
MRDEQTRAGRNNSSGPPVEIKQKSVGGPVRMEGGGFMSHIVKGEHRDTKIPFTDEEIMAQELNNLTEEQLSTLDTDAPPYLLAVQKESYRLFSVLAVLLRVAPCDFSVCGYHIPKGTALHLNTYYANRNNEVWERADEFLPERWIPGHALATKCQENLVSFGAGSLQDGLHSVPRPGCSAYHESIRNQAAERNIRSAQTPWVFDRLSRHT